MKSQHWYIIVNPRAGNWAVQNSWSKLEKLIRTYLSVAEFVFTDGPQHAIQLSKTAVENGYKKIMAIGGDGTGHEVANGILGQSQFPSSSIVLALLPIGTGNDWIKSHLPSLQAEKVLKAIKTEQTCLQDVGKVQYLSDGVAQERFFINVAGLAYDGYIGKKVAEANARKGKLAYLWQVFHSLMEYDLRKARVTLGKQVVEDYFYTINAGICRYSGGGMQLVPHAVLDDGLLAITLAGALKKWEVLLQTPKFYNGQIGRHQKVTLLQSAHVKIEAIPGQKPTLLEADGEFLGETPVSISILKNALQVICHRE
ncbi:MAG TPA: diacylglycerol kinase family lipid kinase [Saprospiraceae bacterium]|nr:diacylglycerol kinase family lipid kinase [Saprospiraceae bacterium]HMQ84944.1 diacylglycerol kinase family lipid kinase [Saprospiraceae bacterium]